MEANSGSPISQNTKKTRMIPFFSIFFILAFMTFSMFTACTATSARAKPTLVEKEAPKAGVVAKINGEEISEDMLIGDGRDRLNFISLMNQEYEMKMERLNDLIVDKIIGAEAKKAGLATADYIDKKVAKGPFKTTDAEYKKFLATRGYPESRITPDIKEEIFKGLAAQKKRQAIEAYAFKATKGSPVEVYFKKPNLKLEIEIGKAPTFGNTSSTVKIVEFSDFQCPYCSQAAKTVIELKKKYGSKVLFVFKHFPLPMHPNAKPAAEASMCVFDQGADKFWKFHDTAFKNQENLDAPSLAKYAEQSGANPKQYEECLSSGKYKGFIQSDMDYANKLGVNSTPTFFVNGNLVPGGARSVEQFSEVIDEALKNTSAQKTASNS